MTRHHSTTNHPALRRAPRPRAIAIAASALISLASISGDVVGVAAASTVPTMHATAIANLDKDAVTPSVARHQATRSRPKHVVTRAVLQNVAPSPDFLSSSCSSATVSVACVSEELAAIDNAQRSEGVAPITIDSATFAALSGPEQVFVTTNLERIAHGLVPVAALTAQLNLAAAGGVAASGDPSLNGWTLTGNKAVTSWASNWAGGLDVLGADYFWMYDDGVGFNIDCPTATAQGCWGHRNNVLLANPTAASCTTSGAKPTLAMGAALGATAYHGTPGIAELLVESCGGLPTDTTITWRTMQRRLATSARV